MRKMKDISDMKFGRLTAIAPVAQYKSNKNYIWFCKCDCGNTYVVSENRLQQKKATCCLQCRKKREVILWNYLKAMCRQKIKNV